MFFEKLRRELKLAQALNTLTPDQAKAYFEYEISA